MNDLLLPPVPYEVLENGALRSTVDPGEQGYEGRGTPSRISITPEEAGILTALAIDKRVLEIGTGLGVSTKALARRAFSVFTFDIDPWVQEKIWPSLPSNVMPNPLPEWISRMSADLVFIDGLHTRAALAKDIAFAQRFCAQGRTLMLFHDVRMDVVHETILDVLKQPVEPLWKDSNLGWVTL